MAVLKCKMCGGDLVFEPGATVCECEYCGSKQTIPNADNEKKMTLFARANRLLRSCEFDKAEGIFSSIAAEFPEEAEAYWGLVLCKYGIEYVDDPVTGKKVPTCHRSSFNSVMDDTDFDQVMENADTVARAVYREQAKQIEEIRKGIIEVSGKEAPYDIFICYKETAEDGQRTIDSVLAQDVYDALTVRGYRVFFSRISLEDKLGTEYEPYIFAALNSAKVMLAFGTTYDYYNAVWVKNEWSRFLKLMTADKSKYLIPCYKDIDAYDIPKEFAKLQAQDLGKVGAVQDLIRGIDKLFGKDQKQGNTSQPQVIQQVVAGGSNAAALLKRGYDSLEDGEFKEAKGFFNDALNMEAESAEAYLGLFLAETGSRNKAEAGKKYIAGDYTGNRYWKRAKQYVKGELAGELAGWEGSRNARLREEAEAEEKRKAAIRESGEKKRAEISKIKSRLAEIDAGHFDINPEDETALAKLKTQAEEAKAAAEQAKAELAAMREQVKIHRQKTDEEIRQKQERMAGLGFFKGKEKKELQGQIESLKASLDKEAKALQKKEYEAEQSEAAYTFAQDQTESFSNNIIVRAKESLLKKGYSILFDGADVNTGSIVKFGRYETGNGIEPIRWRVLESGSGLLLITEQAIDCRKYNEEYVSVTWETCSLRKWLNEEFISSAFNETEQGWIKASTVSTHKNPHYSTNPGVETVDMVFLLSIEEAENYFKTNEDRKCKPTQYAVKQGVYVIGGNCPWWLRSPVLLWNHAADVEYGGWVKDGGTHVINDNLGIRPALWIDLGS